MIGIDVGGANLKIVDRAGVHVHYCPLWQGAPLRQILMGCCGGRDTKVAVTMSGELADCFENKAAGISFIVTEVKRAFPSARFYGTDGRFHASATPSLAASNWLASADLLRKEYPGGVLVDFGSTTTDIIPLHHFGSLKGLTDLARLQKGYLVYTGLLRGNVATLLHSVVLEGTVTPVSTEFFASAADAHLVLGHIGPDQYTCETPDQREKSVAAACRRLARVVCADLDEIGAGGAREIASQFWEAQRHLIRRGVIAAAGKPRSRSLIFAGIGSTLLSRELGGINLTGTIGAAADALPAYAVRELARMRSPGWEGRGDGGTDG